MNKGDIYSIISEIPNAEIKLDFFKPLTIGEETIPQPVGYRHGGFKTWKGGRNWPNGQITTHRFLKEPFNSSCGPDEFCLINNKYLKNDK